MLLVGFISYFLIEMGYSITPLVIGMILGPITDVNLRRGLIVSEVTLLSMFTRPVTLILLILIALMILKQMSPVKKLQQGTIEALRNRRSRTKL